MSTNSTIFAFYEYFSYYKNFHFQNNHMKYILLWSHCHLLQRMKIILYVWCIDEGLRDINGNLLLINLFQNQINWWYYRKKLRKILAPTKNIPFPKLVCPLWNPGILQSNFESHFQKSSSLVILRKGWYHFTLETLWRQAWDWLFSFWILAVNVKARFKWFKVFKNGPRKIFKSCLSSTTFTLPILKYLAPNQSNILSRLWVDLGSTFQSADFE